MPVITRDIDKYTKDYNNSDFEHILVKYRRKKVLEILNKYNPQCILEVGCGSDAIFNYYNEFEKYTIVEPSKEFCKIAQNSQKYSEKINIINGFLEEEVTMCANQEYDFIIVSCLLHEVQNPQLLLSAIKQLSSLKTIIHINVPNSMSFHLLWAYKAGLIPNIGIKTERAKKLQQNTIFDLNKLTEIVTQNGFNILDKGSYFVKPFDHKKMQRLVDNNYIDENLLNGLYDLIEYLPEYGAEIFVNCEVPK